MTTNEKIDHTFRTNGNLTLIAGNGPSQRRLLVSARRMIECSQLLRAAILNPAKHDPNHPHLMIRKCNNEHKQLFFLTDHPEAWVFLCAVLYPEAGVEIGETQWAVKLEAAQYAARYEMTVWVARKWPRLAPVPMLEWKDIWMAMHAAFLLDMAGDFDFISREITYGYDGELTDFMPLSNNCVWAQIVIAAMDEVRRRIRDSMIRIIGITSDICVEPARFQSCDNPKEQCPHQQLLASDIWDRDENKMMYSSAISGTPNDIGEFYMNSPYLRQWLHKAQDGFTASYVGKPRAKNEAEMFNRRWNSAKGPLGICMYCDATEPPILHKCRIEFCRRVYEDWIQDQFGSTQEEGTGSQGEL